MKKKIIFLDVDGVLNSWRNIAAFGGFPFPNEANEVQLDNIAIGMIRQLCNECGAEVVLHSMWRLHVDPIEFGKKHGLPIIGATHSSMEKVPSIFHWLDANPGVGRFVIIDDDNIFWNQRGNPRARHAETLHIRTNMLDGFTLVDFANTWLALMEMDLSEIDEIIKRRSVLIAKNTKIGGISDTRTEAEKMADDAELAELTPLSAGPGRWIVERLVSEGALNSK